MVRLEVIQATVEMPDMARVELRLVPMACDQQDECQRRRIRCRVFVHGGEDPCPDAWY